MAAAVFILCALTSLMCATLLLRSYRRTGTQLLLWSGLCFLGLTLENSLLFVDLVLIPTVDLSVWRNTLALLSFSLLVYGLVGESR